MVRQYILNENREPVPEPDLLAWARWMEEHRKECGIARDDLGEGIWVSTVFLGLDHELFARSMPALFETVVFYENQPSEIVRYATAQEAEKGHDEIVEWACRKWNLSFPEGFMPPSAGEAS